MTPLRILCIDDNAILGAVMVKLLLRAGHHAEFVLDGVEGWRRLSAEGCFDVVVTDHEMPGMRGLELVERIRGTGYSGRIVVHSASLAMEERRRYSAVGVDAILKKSSSLDALLRAVRPDDPDRWRRHSEVS